MLGKPYETCKSCETLKQQLEFERSEKQKLTEVLLNIINPKIAIQDNPPVEIAPVIQTSGLFARRRAALEARDRQEASLLKEAKHLGKPDNKRDDIIDKKIEELETELNILNDKPNEQIEKAQGE